MCRSCRPGARSYPAKFAVSLRDPRSLRTRSGAEAQTVAVCGSGRARDRSEGRARKGPGYGEEREIQEISKSGGKHIRKSPEARAAPSDRVHPVTPRSSFKSPCPSAHYVASGLTDTGTHLRPPRNASPTSHRCGTCSVLERTRRDHDRRATGNVIWTRDRVRSRPVWVAA